MPLELFGPNDLILLRRASQAAAATLREVGSRLAPGISTAQVDAWAHADTLLRGAQPSVLGFRSGHSPPFPSSVCTSRNHVVCHGVPCSDDVLEDGDILNVDVTSQLDGFHGDTSATFLIGKVDSARRELVECSRLALAAGIAEVRPGGRIGDIGAAIAAFAQGVGMHVVEQFCGHGIGRRMHMPPQVPHTGKRGSGLRLRVGMAFTIEPMLTFHPVGLRVLDDGWTVVTEDGSPSAQFEHTVLVTEDGCEVLTALDTGRENT